MDKQMELLQGTLDMLILKAVSLGPLHGYGVLLRIQQSAGKQQSASGHRRSPHKLKRSWSHQFS